MKRLVVMAMVGMVCGLMVGSLTVHAQEIEAPTEVIEEVQESTEESIEESAGSTEVIEEVQESAEDEEYFAKLDKASDKRDKYMTRMDAVIDRYWEIIASDDYYEKSGEFTNPLDADWEQRMEAVDDLYCDAIVTFNQIYEEYELGDSFSPAWNKFESAMSKGNQVIYEMEVFLGFITPEEETVEMPAEEVIEEVVEEAPVEESEECCTSATPVETVKVSKPATLECVTDITTFCTHGAVTVEIK